MIRILVYPLTFLFCYLIVAFALWDINWLDSPADWFIHERVMFMICLTVPVGIAEIVVLSLPDRLFKDGD